MQLTWESNYKIYKSYRNVECISNYNIIAENLYYACDSAGWYWKQGKVLSVSKRWNAAEQGIFFDHTFSIVIMRAKYPCRIHGVV